MPTDEQRAVPLDSSPPGRPRAVEWIPLLFILALAAWLRLGWPGVNSFSFDEARVSHMALQMAREGRFAALGMQSSTGVPNFPAAVWLYALPFAITPDRAAGDVVDRPRQRGGRVGYLVAGSHQLGGAGPG